VIDSEGVKLSPWPQANILRPGGDMGLPANATTIKNHAASGVKHVAMDG
jgi:hypothetical protein